MVKAKELLTLLRWYVFTLINLKEMMGEEVITETPRLPTSRISVPDR